MMHFCTQTAPVLVRTCTEWISNTLQSLLLYSDCHLAVIELHTQELAFSRLQKALMFNELHVHGTSTEQTA
jgi:hypothetical protein